MNIINKIDLFLNEIITKDNWSEYKTKFYDTFDKEAYKESIKQVTALFKKLNKGKVNKTLVFDFDNKKPIKLNSDDMKVINLLIDLGYNVNKESYKTGVVYKNNKEKSIIDILMEFARKSNPKSKERLQQQYDQKGIDQIKQQLDFIENMESLNLIKNGKLNLRKLSIYKNNDKKIVFTYDHRAIASQSTDVGWTSCMNLNTGYYSENVGAGASDGVFIAYLVKPGDEYTLDSPTARVLFKPYKGMKTNNIYWKADKIYGTAPEDFRKKAQEIIDSVQGKVPKESDIYSITSNTYVDELETEIDTRDQETLKYVALNDENWFERSEATKKITDQETLKQVVLNDDNANVRQEAVDRITDQETLKQVVLNDDNANVRLKVIERLTDQETLKQVALNDKDIYNKRLAIDKITNQEFLKQIALNNDVNSKVRRSAIEKITDQETLKQVALNDDNDINRLDAVRKITDQEFLKHIALNDKEPVVRSDVIKKITDQETLKQVVLNDKIRYIKIETIDRITDQEFLKQITLSDDTSGIIKIEANKRLKELGY